MNRVPQRLRDMLAPPTQALAAAAEVVNISERRCGEMVDARMGRNGAQASRPAW